MTTVASVLNGCRYDLRNYGDVDFDIDQTIHYMNRAIQILDARLMAFNSDQTLTSSVVTLAKGYDYASVPTRCLALREVWIDQRRKHNVDQQDLYYRRQFKKNVKDNGDAIAVGNLCKTITQSTTDLTGLGAADNNADTYWVCTVAGTLGSGDSVWVFDGQEPMYWAHVREQIQWDAASSTAYNVRVIYDQGSADVTSDGNMPFSGTYDDVIREVTVQMAVHKKHKTDSPTDAIYAQIFDQILTMDMTNRRFHRKPYRLDF
jgi:hypothetical protein